MNFGRGADLNKEELCVAMATIPKKGLITLTTGQEKEVLTGKETKELFILCTLILNSAQCASMSGVWQSHLVFVSPFSVLMNWQNVI
jgi:hypothetical protein